MATNKKVCSDQIGFDHVAGQFSVYPSELIDRRGSSAGRLIRLDMSETGWTAPTVSAVAM